MSMAQTPQEPRWDDAHTEMVPLVYVRYVGTSGACEHFGPAPPIRVCKTCRKFKSLWRWDS